MVSTMSRYSRGDMSSEAVHASDSSSSADLAPQEDEQGCHNHWHGNDDPEPDINARDDMEAVSVFK